MLAAPALAQGVDLKGDVKVIHTVEENGSTKEVLDEPARVVPGDHLVFTTHYRNTGTDPAEDFVVTNPLPGAVALERDGDFEVSVDGGATWGPLASLTVADGDAGTRPATVDDVTHVRWTIANIPPGAEGDLQYFAVVR